MIAVISLLSILLTSCYSYTTVVGSGAQSNQQTEKWNHYFIYGLAPGDVSIPKDLAGGSVNYTVNTKQTFVNGLLAGITFGIYTPTTTTITK